MTESELYDMSGNAMSLVGLCKGYVAFASPSGPVQLMAAASFVVMAMLARHRQAALIRRCANPFGSAAVTNASVHCVAGLVHAA